MIELGDTLRKTREEKGLTQSQIAQSTHLLVQQIDAIEREDFSKIAAPIYGRGFVKLYCEALGLEPKPFVEAFMEIYLGNRQPSIKTRPPRHQEPARLAEPPPEFAAGPVPSAQPLTAPAPAPAAATPEAETAGFSLEQETIPSNQAGRADSAFAEIDFDDAPATPRPLSRYSTPVPLDADEDKPRFEVPPVVWRVLALGVAAILLLWLITSGLRAIYRASMSTDGSTQADAPAEEAAPVPEPVPAVLVVPAGAGTPKREAMTIPPLYID